MKKEFPTYDDLICFEHILSSHDDYSIVEDLYAGFDDDHRLVIVCDHTDYDEPVNNSSTYAFVSNDEAFELSQSLCTTLSWLPRKICANMAGWQEIRCPMPSHVRGCFDDIVYLLTSKGCHPRIIRKKKPDVEVFR